MKQLYCSLIAALCLWHAARSQTIVGGQQVITLPSSPWATTQALLSLPSDYDSSSTTTYPLILFLHGVGQAGTDITTMLSDQGGIPYRISTGWVPQAVNPKDGKTYKFIVVSPQSPSWSYQYQQIQFILPGILAKYRVDTTRIYITGLSAGGNGALTCITDDPHFCGKIAAVSVMSAASITSTEAAAMKNVATNYLPFWDICGTADPNGFYPPNVAYVDSVWLHNPNPTPDSTWLYNVGHSSWFQGYDPTWTGRGGHTTGINMYQWFLLWQRGNTIPWGPNVTSSTPPSPVAKTVSGNVTITLPLDSTLLNASASTPPSGGTISSYQWSVLSGPTGYTLRSPYTVQTELTNLAAGTYKVLLTVTGNLGGVGYDTVTVTVNPSTHNPPVPVITPTSTTLTLPANSTTLNGASSTDAGATISSYTWAMVSGPATPLLVNNTTSVATVSALVSGTYIFSLTLKDNLGATATGYDTVIVNNPAPSNTPPVAAVTNGSVTVNLPTDTTVLNGTPSTPPAGGTITGYQWAVLSGPAGSSLSAATSSVTTLKGLVAGVYKVSLTVTDGAGITGVDTVTVTVDTVAAGSSTCSGKRILLTQAGDGGITLQGENLAYQPGDTLVIPNTGTPYTWIDFTDLYGTATCPVTIINSGGQVHATVRFNCGNCRFVHMTGTGSAGTTYGFLLENASRTSAGIDVYGRSANVEIDHFSMHNMDYGIWVKQDQGCIDSLNYPNWIIDHISIHDNRIVGMYDEGMYLGTTDPNGTRIVTCNGTVPNPLPKPLRLSNFSIYNNYIDSTGRSGIQLSCAQTGDNEIYDNHISNSGQQLNSQQGNGISLGGYTTAHVHNNLISNTFTMGIFSLGAGLERIDHNTISLSGHLEGGSPQSASIMVDTRPTTPADSTNFIINNNTLGTNSDVNIRVYNSYATYSYANVICSNTTVGGAPATLAVPAAVHYTTNCTNLPPGNGAPVARAGGNYTITLPVDTVTLNGSGSTDATAPIIMYSWTLMSGPGKPELSNGATPTPLLSNLGVGTYKILLTVMDTSGVDAVDTATVIVNPASTAGTGPVAYAGGNDTLYLPTDSLTLNGTGSYARGGATLSSYQWKVISGPTGYVLAGATSPLVALSNMKTAGTYKVSLTVTDSKGVSASDTAVITVLPYNQIPVSVILTADTSITLPTALTLDGSHSYVVNSLISAYQWTQVSGPSTATITSSTASATTITGLVAGTYVFQLTVSDLQGQPASATITIHVAAGTGGPVANAGGNQTITLPTNSVTLNGSGSSESGTGSISSYQWTLVSGPTGYVLTNGTAVQATLGSLVAGTYKVSLTVKDNNGKTSSDTVTITVNPAPLGTPVANAGSDQAITLPLDSVSLNGSGSSENGNGNITGYQWSVASGPTGSSFSSATSVATTLRGLSAGTYDVVLTVTDNNGKTASDTMIVTVHAAVLNPVAVISNTDTVQTLPISSFVLDGSTSYAPAGTSITGYAWTQVSGPSTATLATPATATTAVSGLVAGTYVFQLTVMDGQGRTASTTIHLVVNAAVLGTPVANAGGNITITLPVNSVILNGSGSTETGGTGQIVSYNWQVTSGPRQYLLTGQTSAQASLDSLVTGTYTVVLTVTDNNGKTARDSALITVQPGVSAPVAVITADTLVTLPDSLLTLDGSQSYVTGSGTITAYDWTEIAGPTTVIQGTASGSSISVTGLAVGTYLFQLTVTTDQGQTGTATITVHVSAASTAQTISGIGIWPNPVHNNLNIRLNAKIAGQVALQVYNTSGNLVLSDGVLLDGQTTASEQLNVSNLTPGMYFLQVVTLSGKTTLKFVKH
ncbi:PKD domain-containing protein [Dinghuibacter silviterrae]|uniref:Putative secreted protein (Por secretion system target) n=1 Tax=Dinghuibacter silviterrae TaxID=1539049 RepID=A0A4R8DVH1_9BACT|nr:PKD domain-containing protein [Dinghuibacter silviterrae]TDX01918.1 putative secreted protein (Por secretion system target) [Dinghuibacter silviterrae]